MHIHLSMTKAESVMANFFQDELETVPFCPNLSIGERNLGFMWVCGNSRIQLGIVRPAGFTGLPFELV